MVPVDLRHGQDTAKAIGVAAGLARQFEAEVHLVGVTSSPPNEVAHNPDEYRERLEALARQRSDALGVALRWHAVESLDPAVDLDRCLKQAAEELDADLIVMASHVPRFGEWLVHSHARWLAAHTARSMFIVR